MVEAGEDVEERPLGRRREADAVGRDRRHAEGRRQADERVGVARFVPPKVTLQLDVHAAAAEDADETIEQAADAVPPAVERGAAGERHQAGRAAVELVEPQRAFAFRRAHLHARDQLTKVAIALRAFAENRKHEGLDRQDGLEGRPAARAAR